MTRQGIVQVNHLWLSFAKRYVAADYLVAVVPVGCYLVLAVNSYVELFHRRLVKLLRGALKSSAAGPGAARGVTRARRRAGLRGVGGVCGVARAHRLGRAARRLGAHGRASAGTRRRALAG